jgi:hypothetical protein
MLSRVRVMTGVLAGLGLLLVCGCSDPDEAKLSPFEFRGQRVGMPLDALEQSLIARDGGGWTACDTLSNGMRRCSLQAPFVTGEFEALADPQGRVVRMRMTVSHEAPGDMAFDRQLSAMEKAWFKVKGMRVDDGGVSDAHPSGRVTFSTARGRWTAIVTFAGAMCWRSSYPCPDRIELADARAGVDTIP